MSLRSVCAAWDDRDQCEACGAILRNDDGARVCRDCEAEAKSIEEEMQDEEDLK
jgi:uncharacterized Zn finger protein (UPF0148 family)